MTIEVHEFLRGGVAGESVEPSFEQIARVADVQAAMARSWETRTWENVTSE